MQTKNTSNRKEELEKIISESLLDTSIKASAEWARAKKELEKLENQTHVCICGMNFYITWKNENEGYDTRGTKWINKNNPQCTDERVVNIALDTYNKIMQLNQKQ